MRIGPKSKSIFCRTNKEKRELKAGTLECASTPGRQIKSFQQELKNKRPEKQMLTQLFSPLSEK